MTRPPRITDGEHHAVTEAVIANGVVILDRDQSRLDHLIKGNAFCCEFIAQPGPVIAGVADAEFLLDGGREITVREIAPRFGTVRGLQLRLKKFGGNFHDIIKACTRLLALNLSFGNDRHGQSGITGQLLHRFRKTQACLLDEEGEDITRRLAAKTVIAPLPVIGMEAR
jgi:hypothetical protein